MYLSNTELRGMSDQIITGCDHEGHPFTEAQIRVCSIDLRVGPVFWKFIRRRRPVDLMKHSIFEISERRLWKKVVLRQGESIALRPGEMLLGSTYERINMPQTHVGKINTRSSYARLGLSTACNCDLVNPGYVGNVPLELINSTRNTFLIHPYLPLCQLFVMRVDGEVDASYSNDRFSSLYMNDDGGPSRWWRDELAKKISTKALPDQMEEATLSALRRKFEKIDDDGIFRLEKLLDKRRFGNSEELMQAFRSSERWRSLVYKVVRQIFRWAFPFMVVLLLRRWLEPAIPQLSGTSTISLSWMLYALTVVLAAPCLYFFVTPSRRYYSVIDETKPTEE